MRSIRYLIALLAIAGTAGAAAVYLGGPSYGGTVTVPASNAGYDVFANVSGLTAGTAYPACIVISREAASGAKAEIRFEINGAGDFGCDSDPAGTNYCTAWRPLLPAGDLVPPYAYVSDQMLGGQGPVTNVQIRTNCAGCGETDAYVECAEKR